MRFIKSKKGIALLATLVVVAISAVGAYAYFTAGASGTGGATVGTPTDLTIVQKGTVTGLVPGGPAKEVEYKIKNTTNAPEYLNYVLLGVSDPSGYCSPAVSDPADPTVDNFTLTQNGGLTIGEIQPGQTFDSSTLPGGSGLYIAMNDLSTNQDGCQGDALTLTFTAFP